MAEEISLDAQQLQSALAILQREQRAYLPSRRQRGLYLAFTASVYALLGVVLLQVMVPDEQESPLFSVGALGLEGILMLSTVVLFILNWGFMRKVYRLARLRKRLNLVSYFAPAFKAERRTTRFVNALTQLIAVLGGLFILMAVIAGIATPVLHAQGFLLAFSESMYLIMALLGASFVSLYYLRRGKQQLEVVLRLQQALLSQAAPAGQPNQATVSSDEFDAIAELERQQIDRDRAGSIALARRELNAPGYLCQSSREMYDAKSKLPAELRVKVEGAIADLLANPSSPAAAHDGPEAIRTMAVAGTPLKIQYDLDEGRNLIRLHDLQDETAAVQAFSKAGGSNGFS